MAADFDAVFVGAFESSSRLSSAYKPDAAFEKTRAAFAEAVAQKDVNALAGLVAPMFFWTVDGRQANEMDLGRDAVHNFKVAFGFRAPGKTADGGTGATWLAAMAKPGITSTASSSL